MIKYILAILAGMCSWALLGGRKKDEVKDMVDNFRSLDNNTKLSILERNIKSK